MNTLKRSKALKNLLIVLLVSGISCQTALAKTPTKEELIQSCNKAIDAQKKHTDELELGLSSCEKAGRKYNEMLDRKNKELDSLWRRPEFTVPVFTLAGAVIGAVLIGVLKK